MATQLLLLVRAVNYQVSLQDFTACILCSLESLGDAASALKESGDAVQVGACVFPDKASESGNFFWLHFVGVSPMYTIVLAKDYKFNSLPTADAYTHPKLIIHV